MTDAFVDTVVVGAGVVGLAAARALAYARSEVLVLEAEASFGTVTSARNSEVVHGGLYYENDSMKARTCIAGRERLYAFCAERGVPHRVTGKLVVATTAGERDALDALFACARANGVEGVEWLEGSRVRALEPAVRADAALLSPRTGIVDSHAFMLALVGDLEAAGGQVVCRSPVFRVEWGDRGFELEVGGREPMRLGCRQLVNAAGHGAQALARATEGVPDGAVPEAFFARGRYYGYAGRAPVSHLIYPVPVSGGLGIHGTLDLAGALRFGPDVQWIDALDHGFEDDARDAFVSSIQRWLPELRPDQLVPGYTGVRPKIVAEGAPAGDFRVDGPARHGVEGLVQCFGIESPGLTASLALADEIVSALAGERAREGTA